MALAAGLAVAAGDAADDTRAVARSGLHDGMAVGGEDEGTIVGQAADRRRAAIAGGDADAASRVGGRLRDRGQAGEVDARAADIADEDTVGEIVTAPEETARIGVDDTQAIILPEPRHIGGEDALLAVIFTRQGDIAPSIGEVPADHSRNELGGAEAGGAGRRLAADLNAVIIAAQD